nr:MAG TPA: hypothetical protein [Caudoviricetes sp.]DAK85553.1 MAG TPA: hypothetical protein [Caudoviricetes sp.]
MQSDGWKFIEYRDTKTRRFFLLLEKLCVSVFFVVKKMAKYLTSAS